MSTETLIIQRRTYVLIYSLLQAATSGDVAAYFPQRTTSRAAAYLHES